MAEEGDNLSDEEELLQKIAEAEGRYRELMRGSDDLYDALGISPTEAHDVLSNSSKEEWKTLIARAKELEKELFQGKVTGVRRRVIARRKKRKLKKRGKRMLGARRGWLDAR